MVKTIIQRPGFCFWFLLTSAVGKEAASIYWASQTALCPVESTAPSQRCEDQREHSGKDFEPHIKSNK